MKKIVILILTIIILGPVKAYSQIVTTPISRKPKNCHIMIDTVYKTGEVKQDIRRFNFPNIEKCKKMNRILSDNFSPKEVKSVKTTMEWGLK